MSVYQCIKSLTFERRRDTEILRYVSVKNFSPSSFSTPADWAGVFSVLANTAVLIMCNNVD